jgi:hypothetical protein
MNIGMLWFDNDPKVNLDTKIERAALYYARKYGRNPTLCFVHPSMLGNTNPKNEAASPALQKRELIGGSIEVRSNRSVLPNHFWIGINNAPEAAVAA